MAFVYDPTTGEYYDDGMDANGTDSYVDQTDLYWSDPDFLNWVNQNYPEGQSLESTNTGTTNWNSLLSSLGSFASTPTGSQVLSTGGNLLGGYLNTQAAKEAAATQAAAQIRAAQVAAEAQKFKPVGVTTRFGQSQFGYDPNGNLMSAGYNVSPELKVQQDQLMSASGGMLNQFTGSQAATAPMGAGAQRMFSLGQGYLNTDPQAQAQKYMADQQTVLSASRAKAMADLQATMQAQGRGGLAIGGDAGMGASNPQLQALLNAQLQQDRELAAQATQGGMDYAKFGAGLMGSGGQMLRDMYGTQSAAYQPYQTALGGAKTIEGLGQNAMDLGIDLGSKETASRGSGGQLLYSGMTNAANTVGNVNQQAGSTWGNLLQGGAGALSQYRWGQ